MEGNSPRSQTSTHKVACKVHDFVKAGMSHMQQTQRNLPGKFCLSERITDGPGISVLLLLYDEH